MYTKTMQNYLICWCGWNIHPKSRCK